MRCMEEVVEGDVEAKMEAKVKGGVAVLVAEGMQ